MANDILLSAEGALTLRMKVGDYIMFDGLQFIYVAGPDNREQFRVQGVNAHSAEISRKEFQRLSTHVHWDIQKPKHRGAFSPNIENHYFKKLRK